MYISTQSTTHVKFFDYLNPNVEHILTTFAEIEMKPKSASEVANLVDKLTSLIGDLELLAQPSTSIPDRLREGSKT